MDNTQKFIDCALQQKYITLKDIRECKEIQKNLPTLGIDKILQTHGFLDENECNIIHAILKYKNEDLSNKLDTSVMKKKDRAIADVLVNENILTIEQIGKVVHLQKQLKQSGQSFLLINVIAAKNLLWQDGSWENWQEAKEHSISKIIYLTPIEKDAKGFLIDKNEISMKFLGKKEWTLGRFPASNKILIKENTVSRIHCKIVFEEKKWKIVDMMSALGVFLNQNRIQKEILFNNDIIRVGSQQFQIKM